MVRISKPAIKGRQQVDLSLQGIVHNEGILLRRVIDPYGNILHPLPNGVQLPQEIPRLIAVMSHRNGIPGLDLFQRLRDGDKLGLI